MRAHLPASMHRVPALLLVLLVACGGGSPTQDQQVTAAPPLQSEPESPPAASGDSVGAPSEAAPQPPIAEPTGPGRLETATHLNRIAATEIQGAVQSASDRIPALTPLYDVVNHRLTYLTHDAHGNEVVASGLVSVPAKAGGARSPLLAYQHGTIFRDRDAPSNNAAAFEPAVILASLGYIVVAADYVGYGASRGTPHPYLLAAPSAAAVIDLLTATKTWRRKNRVADNGQLFLTGYSEGGYVTVAAHRALQAAGSEHLAGVAAALPAGGPYHVQATLDGLLERVRDENRFLGALVNPGLLRRLGSALRRQVRDELLDRMLPGEVDVVFDTRVLDYYLADDTAAIERESNVHDWAPVAQASLFHGRDDQTVPYRNAQLTLDAMRTRGAGSVGLFDCAALPSSHIGCVPHYLAFMLGQFGAQARDL